MKKKLLIGLLLLVLIAGLVSMVAARGWDRDHSKPKCNWPFLKMCHKFMFGCDRSWKFDCGELPERLQDKCCAMQNRGTPHIACAGYWHYNEIKGDCEWKCTVVPIPI